MRKGTRVLCEFACDIEGINGEVCYIENFLTQNV